MEINDSTFYVRNPEPVTAKIDEELVMLSVDMGRYFHLNDSAACIWKILEVPVTPTDIYAELERTFQVSPEDCRSEARSFLLLLLKKELIRETTHDRA